VNRQLRAWVTSDLIAIDDGRITVRDLEALDLLAGDQAG
jgi:hypothetical protein